MATTRKTSSKRISASKPHAATGDATLQALIDAIALDEELVLANLAFDPTIAGRQLKQRNFGVNDFAGIEGNRVLLGTMLACLDAEETLNLPNLMARLEHENKAGRSKLEVAGGRDRVHRLFTSPFSAPGVKLLEDIDPVVESIRDRNLRVEARRSMIEYAEKVARPDLDGYETIHNCIQALRQLFMQRSYGQMTGLDANIEEMRELISANQQKKKSYLGYNVEFPILQERLNGIQKEFYLMVAGAGMGKTTFATQLAWELALQNPELSVIFCSLDQNRLDVSAKMISQCAEVPIDYVRNPYVTNIAFEKKRQEGLEKVAGMRDRITVVDENNGVLYLDDIKRLARRTRLKWGGDVALVIDPIMKIRLKEHGLKFNEKANVLASELKSLAATEGITVFATAGLPKAISNRRPEREDLEEIVGLLYDPYAVFFLYCDYLTNFDTPFLEWQWGKDNFMIPISELTLAKYKMGQIRSRIFYRYYESFSKYKECAPQEVENYNAMIENLEKFKDQKTTKPHAGDGKGRQEEF